MLSNKLALITGSGSGIGKAICKLFAKNGANLALVDVSCNLGELESEIRRDIEATSNSKNAGAGVKISSHTCDVSNSAQVNALFADIKKHHSQIANVIVNSAGITRDAFLVKMSEKDFDDVIGVNLKGTYLVTQAAARHLIENMPAAKLPQMASYGSIINLSSISGRCGNIGQINYVASKSAVMGMTLTTAKELGRYKIRCNSILPGFIRTPMTDKVPAKNLQMIEKMIPLGKLGEPEDIAQLALFLASDASSYITGANIECTGGLSI
jgi:17beta-estradiol 17-dehydrogenase/3alpha(17beta)-hydroxysteroid dehydrogenase (NAD+)